MGIKHLNPSRKVQSTICIYKGIKVNIAVVALQHGPPSALRVKPCTQGMHAATSFAGLLFQCKPTSSPQVWGTVYLLCFSLASSAMGSQGPFLSWHLLCSFRQAALSGSASPALSRRPIAVHEMKVFLSLHRHQAQSWLLKYSQGVWDINDTIASL